MVNLYQPVNFGGGMSGGMFGTPGSAGGAQVIPGAGVMEGIVKIAEALQKRGQTAAMQANIQEAIKAGQGWANPDPVMEGDQVIAPAGTRMGGGINAIAEVLAKNPHNAPIGMKLMAEYAMEQAKPRAGYSLSPGGARYNSQNQKVAERPETPKEPTTVQLARAMGLKEGSPEWNAFIRDVALKPDVQIGDKTPIGKLLADRESLIARGLKPDHPALLAIDREIAKAGVPSGEQTRTQEMVASGLRTMEDIMGRLLPGGKADMGAVREMWAELPFSEGRTTASQMKEVASFILRLETGAQANEGEIRNTAERYMPKPWDNENTARDKLLRLQKRYETAKRIAEGRPPDESSVAPPTKPPLSSFER